MKIKTKLAQISIILLTAVFILSGCANVDYNNPADAKSDDYVPADIALTADDIPFNSGDTYTFSGVSINESSDEAAFVITNTGFDNLRIEDISISGDDADQFYLNSLYAQPLLSSLSDTFFTMEFRPTDYGAKTAIVTITTSDPDTGIFSFTVNGTTLKPVIAVYRGEELTPVQNGEFIYLGNNAGYIENPDHDFVFYIENMGDDKLTIYDMPDSVNLSELGNECFGLTKNPHFIIEPGKTSTFIINLEETFITDNHYADITIINNDCDNENFIFHLKMKSYARLAASDADPTTGNQFGYSVSISGDYAVIGANWDDDDATSAVDTGAAYIFKREGMSWLEQGKLTASDGAAEDQFGCSVSISGDYAVISSPTADDAHTNSGAVYVFKRSGASWTEQAKLTASVTADDDRFGYSVSISGDYAVIGTLENNYTGSAYIFKRDDGAETWTQQAKLTASDGAENDCFGITHISGDCVIIGADEANGTAGKAYVFVKPTAGWADTTETAILTASDAEANHYLALRSPYIRTTL